MPKYIAVDNVNALPERDFIINQESLTSDNLISYLAFSFPDSEINNQAESIRLLYLYLYDVSVYAVELNDKMVSIKKGTFNFATEQGLDFFKYNKKTNELKDAPVDSSVFNKQIFDINRQPITGEDLERVKALANRHNTYQSFWGPITRLIQNIFASKSNAEYYKEYDEARAEIQSTHLKFSLARADGYRTIKHIKEITKRLENVINNTAAKTDKTINQKMMLATLHRDNIDDAEYLPRPVLLKALTDHLLKDQPADDLINAENLNLPEVPTQYQNKLDDKQTVCYRVAVAIGDKDPSSAYKLLEKAGMPTPSFTEKISLAGVINAQAPFVTQAERALELMQKQKTAATETTETATETTETTAATKTLLTSRYTEVLTPTNLTNQKSADTYQEEAKELIKDSTVVSSSSSNISDNDKQQPDEINRARRASFKAGSGGSN